MFPNYIFICIDDPDDTDIFDHHLPISKCSQPSLNYLANEFLQLLPNGDGIITIKLIVK